MCRHNPVAGDGWGIDDMHLLKTSDYGFLPFLALTTNFNFFISNSEYKDWFNFPYDIFNDTQIVPIPHPITVCENTFDKNVLPIKKLIKDIGDLNNLAVKETKNFFLYDDSNFISNTFFTELNKKNNVTVIFHYFITIAISI